MADSFLSRMVGLLNRSSLKSGEALVITQCQSIHMFFMRFAIDVIFVDADDCVVGLIKEIKPYRLSPIFWTSRYCIELPVGAIETAQVSFGDKLKIDKTV